jgi:hypothetical protein
MMQRVRIALVLLTERRVMLYLLIDGFLLLAGVAAAFGGNGSAPEFYGFLYIMPLFMVAVPMMADAVAVERRAGTLDLVLTSPGAALYFERRIAAVAALATLQGWFALAIPWMLIEHFPLSGPMLQMAVVAAFAAAAALNWAVRMRSAGAVAFLTYVTCVIFAPWFFANPIRPLDATHGPMVFGDYVDYFTTVAVLAAGAAVLYLYARQRLARPESLVT